MSVAAWLRQLHSVTTRVRRPNTSGNTATFVQQQTRRLLGLTMIFIAALYGAYVLSPSTWRWPLSLHLAAAGATALVAMMFVVNRAGFALSAAGITITTSAAAMCAAVLTTITPGGANRVAPLYLVVLPFIASEVVMPVWFTVALTSAVGIFVAVARWTTVPAPLPVPGGYLLATSIMVIAAAMGRRLREIAHERTVEQHKDRLTFLATHDELTGLPNRRLFDDRLARAIERLRRNGGNLALLVLDLDDFKSINDALSHAVGDGILRQIAERLETTLRRTDTVARWDGDEFAVIIEELENTEPIHRVVASILEAVSRPITAGSRRLTVTTSVGVAVAPTDGDDAATIVGRADTALSEAKRKGRNSYSFFTDKMARASLGRLTLAHDLRDALLHRQFFAEYQLQYDALSRRWVGVESLIRWRHPTRGHLQPADFVQLAEQTGYIGDLTQYVLSDAVARLSSDEGAPPRIGINVSAHDLKNTDLPERVHRLLEVSGIEPSRLEVELTENIMFRAIADVRHTLEQLRKLGVRIAIDDFGAGYATLRQLGEFPVHTIKIDRSFAQTLVESPNGEAAVAGIVEIARRLHIDVIAEGVETPTHVRRYQRLGVHLFQGWYFAHAVGWDELPGVPLPTLQAPASHNHA